MINYHFCFVNIRTPLKTSLAKSGVSLAGQLFKHPIAGKGAVIELREIGPKYSVVE